ncbi:malate dehydrogenase [Vibrio variabilis]|uniref:Malate dehydrogenase n=1 Tax=Vibrio variabilis TaxID=990271 RepID=A0ABQ0JC27_9VIBR|nr:malate dehydrogenase [Vibrio variabilis]
MTPGVAADLSHIPTPVSIKGYAGEDPTPALEGADVVLISAGVARKLVWIVQIYSMLTRVS